MNMKRLLPLLLFLLLAMTVQAAVIMEPAVPGNALPGSFFSLSLKITNPTSAPYSNIHVHLRSGDSFEVDNADRDIPLLAPGQSATLQWSVKVNDDAPSGYETMTVQLQSENLDQDLDIPLLIKSIESTLEVQNVLTDPPQLEPGNSGEIFLRLRNHASYTLRNIHVALELASTIPIAPRDGTEERVLESLGPDDTATLNFAITALPKADPGIYTIPLRVTYLDEFGQSYSRGNTITVGINAQPQLRISTEGKVVAGKPGTVTIKVVNTGLTPIQFLTISLLDPAVVSSSQVYLGSLDRDDFQTEQVTILADRSLQIPATIEFRDALNKPFHEQILLPIAVVDQNTAEKLGLEKTSLWWYLLLPVIVVIMIYLVQRVIRKRIIKKKT